MNIGVLIRQHETYDTVAAGTQGVRPGHTEARRRCTGSRMQEFTSHRAITNASAGRASNKATSQMTIAANFILSLYNFYSWVVARAISNQSSSFPRDERGLAVLSRSLEQKRLALLQRSVAPISRSRDPLQGNHISSLHVIDSALRFIHFNSSRTRKKVCSESHLLQGCHASSRTLCDLPHDCRDDALGVYAGRNTTNERTHRPNTHSQFYRVDIHCSIYHHILVFMRS